MGIWSKVALMGGTMLKGTGKAAWSVGKTATLPVYMEDLHNGHYTLPEHTEQSLRNIFSISALKNYFYETIPSMANPLGMGRRSVPLVEKVQNLLIEDFLNYMALRHQVFLSSLSTEQKKKLNRRPLNPAE